MISPLASVATTNRISSDELRFNHSSLRMSDRFLTQLRTSDRIILASHVHPDPDSLGSMLGLSHLIGQTLGTPCIMTRDGEVSRAENRTMIDLLKLQLTDIQKIQIQPGDAVVMVDSQPGTGRHCCTRALDKINCVLDHHVTPGNLEGIPFIDIRPTLGATCTIVTEYLVEQDIRIPSVVATSLFYGLETEVGGFPREATPADDQAMARLYPLCNHDTLAQIRNAPLPLAFFRTLSKAIQGTEIIDRMTFTWIDDLGQPENAAAIVDYMLRAEGIDWAICAGVLGDKVILSVRSAFANAGAGERLRRVVDSLGSAGGHQRRAGGCINLTDKSDAALAALRQELISRCRLTFGVSPSPISRMM